MYYSSEVRVRSRRLFLTRQLCSGGGGISNLKSSHIQAYSGHCPRVHALHGILMLETYSPACFLFGWNSPAQWPACTHRRSLSFVPDLMRRIAFLDGFGDLKCLYRWIFSALKLLWTGAAHRGPFVRFGALRLRSLLTSSGLPDLNVQATELLYEIRSERSNHSRPAL